MREAHGPHHPDPRSSEQRINPSAQNATALRAELGERAGDNLLLEAELSLAKGFPKRPAQLLVLRRRDTGPAA
jgi:hypothetical protein